MKRVFNLAFILFACVLFIGSFTSIIDNAYGQGRGDKRPAYMVVRDSTVTRVLIDPDFLDEIVLKSGSGNAPLADSAITLRLQKLTTGHFVATTLDSLSKFIIDSADFARFVRNGAIDTRLAFSVAFLDTLVGDENNYLILYARNARSADSSAYSDYADEAGTATYAIKYIGTDTIPAARFANIADYAAVAGSALSQQGYFTASQWDSIYDSTQVWFDADSAHYAKVADSLRANALEDTGMITSAIRNSRLVLSSQRDALNRTYAGLGHGAGNALSGTNPPIDSTGARKNFVQLYSADTTKVGFSSGIPNAGGIVADTTNTRLRYKSPGGTAAIFPDSSTIASMINTASDVYSADHVLRGLGGIPNRITTSTSTPSGGTDGDLWVVASGSDTAFYVRYSGSWRELVGGGGGGGSPTSVSTNSWGTVDADSLVPNLASVAETAINGYFVYTNGFMLNNNRSADFLGRIKADSIVSYAGSIFYLGASGDTIKTPSNGWIGRPNNPANSASVAARYMTVQGPCTVRTALFAEDIYVDPHSGDAQEDIGTRAQTFDDIYGEEIQAIGTATANASIRMVQNSDSFYVDHEYLVLRGIDILQANSNTTISDGSITITGGGVTTPSLDIGGGSTWGSSYLQVGGGDSLNIPASASLRIQSTGTAMLRSGAELLVPSDTSNSFADIATGSEQYFLLLDDEKNALRSPCPDVSASNYVISKDWMKRFWTDRFWNATKFESRKDSLRYYYWQFKQPTCNDSLVLDPNNNNSEIVWPTIEGTPIEWPDTAQALILPWITPGLPVGPYWIDSTADGAYYADPVPGLPEGILKVDQRANDTLAYITGRYSTIKAALDSLVTFRCAVGADCTRGSEAGELDTFYVSTKSATISKQLSMYRGSVLVQDSIRQVLPDFITESGAWVKFEKASESAQMWLQVECWINDSIFTVRDSVLRAATIDNTWTLTFAKKPTILVYPPVDGQYINLAETCNIGDYCPVKIKGVDKNSVVLTNKDRDPTPSISQMFKVSGSGVNDTYLGMPIEFEDLTIYYETTAAVVPANVLSGFLKFTNCNLIVKTNGTTSNSFIQFNYYDAATISERARPTFIVDNCVVIADSDVTVFDVAADSVVFQSSNSSYSVSGDNGMVLYFSDKWGEEAPRFSRDEFFFGLSGTYTTPQGKLIETNQNPAGSTEKVKAPSCVFIGLDPATPSNLLTYPSGSPNFLYSATFAYSVDDTKPPAKLRDGLIPVKPPWSPK